MYDHTRDAILVIMNVYALSTNIPNPKGIKAVKETPIAQEDKPTVTKVII